MPTTIAAPKTKTVRSAEDDFLPLDESGAAAAAEAAGSPAGRERASSNPLQ
jgi:hypothetical protein